MPSKNPGSDSRVDQTRPLSRIEYLRLEVYGVLLALFAIALFLALITFDRADVGVGVGVTTSNLLGPVGAHMADLFLWILGLCAFLMDAGFAFLGVRAIVRRPYRFTAAFLTWSLLVLLCTAILLEVVFHGTRPFDHAPGGAVGLYAGQVMIALFSDVGAILIAACTLVLCTIFLAGMSAGALARLIGRTFARVCCWIGNTLQKGAFTLWAALVHRRREETLPDDQPDGQPDSGPFAQVPIHDTVEDARPVIVSGPPDSTCVPDTPKTMDAPEHPQEDAAPIILETAPPVARVVEGPRRPVRLRDRLPGHTDIQPGSYEPPSLKLLDFVETAVSPVDHEVLQRNAETLERKLLDYKVEGKVVEIHPGPVVTMYEFLPAPGVKISQIANLADDLTMALEATSIRIVAPIPGKGVVGIEVPNGVRETVYLREILASDAFLKTRSKLSLALGKDIFGTPLVTDLSKMPHLLIAGATGSGKSVAVNTFILSILYNATPEDVRIILVDPKVVELQVYEGIPHLLLPVVYDPKQAAAALRWAVEEMERRYQLLARCGVRSIQTFNQRAERLRNEASASDDQGASDDLDDTMVTAPDAATQRDDEKRPLPYIVIILDEFADLMMVASKDVETAVARLAQKARAAGIHLIMATQRPSKEVITGLIKANFTSRIAFRVSSKIDSRIILDQSGADALLGAGDMLFLRPGMSTVQRAHGPFVSEEEVHRVVEHLKAQGEPDYDLQILESEDVTETEEETEGDHLLDEARDIVLENRRASISYLQRRLKVGYNRAARLMEQLERRGVVGPPDSRGERQVLA